MNLKEIRDDVRSLIIEPTPGFRSDEELNRWINQGHQLLGAAYRIETFAQVEVITGTTFNPLPEDLLVFKGAWDENNRSIPIIPIGSGSDILDKNIESTAIFRFGDNFVLFDPKEEVSTKRTITIFYDRKPKILRADKDEPDIALPYHMYIVSFATMRAFQKDEDFEAAELYRNEFMEGLERISRHKTPISQDYDIILELIRLNVINPAEAAEWLNIPMKRKVWNRVEIEEKGMAFMQTGIIDRADLLERAEFPDKSDIVERLKQKSEDFITLPGWDVRDDE